MMGYQVCLYLRLFYHNLNIKKKGFLKSCSLQESEKLQKETLIKLIKMYSRNWLTRDDLYQLILWEFLVRFY